MEATISTQHEAAEDVFFGQVVINWARWFIIAAGVVFVLLTADDTTKIVLGVLPLVGLMVMNFYLHGRRLAERPANRALITAASLIDLALITLVVVAWPGANGLQSEFFIMYYPVVLAFAFVMPPKVTIGYTAIAMAVYTGACFLAGASGDDFKEVEAYETLVSRLITLGAMGALGTYYWRIQRDRRRTAADKGADPGVAPAVS